MNSICHNCANGINEGSICRDCRKLFKCLARKDCDYSTCVNCVSCDTNDFPCNKCAGEIFEFVLGFGNGSHYQGTNEGEKLDVDQLLNILNTFNQKRSTNNIINNSNNDHNNTDGSNYDSGNKKRGYYSRYCNLQ